MKIVLPWPDRRLFPNWKRSHHWRAYRPVEQAARKDGNTLTCVALPLSVKKVIAAGDGTIPVTVSFYPPDRRARDDDGMIGAFKNWRDGIADALGVDDKRFRVTYQVCDAEKPGRVEVCFPGIIPTFAGEQDENRFRETLDSVKEKEWPGRASNTPSRDQLASGEQS